MKSLLSFILLFSVLGVQSQSLHKLYEESLKAYSDKNYEKFKSLTMQGLQLNPTQPTLLYNLVVAYTITGENVEAEETLNRLLTWNTQLNYLENKKLKSLLADDSVLQNLSDTKTTYSAFSARSKAVVNLSKTFHLEDLIKIGSSIYCTDVHNGYVLKYHQNTRKSGVLATLPLPAMALAEGIENTTIWVSTAKLPQFKKKISPKAYPYLYEISLKNGSVIDSIVLPGSAILGSMVKGENGLLYASNSSRPEIFVINTKSKKIQKTIAINEGISLQGIDINFTKNKLYIADYLKGILMLDLEQVSNRKWITKDNFLLKGFDGVQFVDRTNLLVIQNNSNPKRVIRINHLDGRVQDIKLLDNKLPLKGEPTNGFFDPETGFYYIANSQWPFYTKDNRPKYDSWTAQQIRFIPLERMY